MEEAKYERYTLRRTVCAMQPAFITTKFLYELNGEVKKEI